MLCMFLKLIYHVEFLLINAAERDPKCKKNYRMRRPKFTVQLSMFLSEPLPSGYIVRTFTMHNGY